MVCGVQLLINKQLKLFHFVGLYIFFFLVRSSEKQRQEFVKTVVLQGKLIDHKVNRKSFHAVGRLKSWILIFFCNKVFCTKVMAVLEDKQINDLNTQGLLWQCSSTGSLLNPHFMTKCLLLFDLKNSLGSILTSWQVDATFFPPTSSRDHLLSLIVSLKKRRKKNIG